jgi:hypothetical protein
MSYVIDIETRKDPALLEVFLENITAPKNIKDEEKIKEHIEAKKAEAYKLMATDADYAEIICVGVKELGKEPKLLSFEEYVKWLGESNKTADGADIYNWAQTMITFNGKNFDLPLLMRTAIKKGVAFPFSHFKRQCDKYKATNHIDLMQALECGWGNTKSLDKYLQIYLGVKKKPVDFATATEQEIREHNIEDLINSELLYRKFEKFLVN